ncbi:MAG: type III pantothenate kinase [Candidatus Promineifilaceae bacterium]|nr:type III pantothenate kinase [Candidatus Promineifilaceae bacterium]
MLLAIDIGNTHITLGLWDGQTWRLQWRLRTVQEKTADEYGIYLKVLLREVELADAVERVIFSSVVPPLTRTFSLLSERYLGCEALQVDARTETGIRIATKNPQEVGADRIVNAVAAHHLCPGACIVIDMGTATTLDVVAADGALLGVVIAPGLELAASALAGRAAQLSRVALEAPPQVLGRTTVHAVQSGLVYGYTALIEGLVRRLKEELALDDGSTVIGTGGLINLIMPHTGAIDRVEPWLTLTGLRLISERVKG